MFEFQWDRAFRRRVGSLFVITCLIAPVVSATPVQAQITDTEQTIAEERKTDPVTTEPGDVDQGSGPTDCTVEVGEGAVRRRQLDVADGETTTITVIEEPGQEYIDGTARPQAVDVDESAGPSTQGEFEAEEIVDGVIELEGVPYNVYSVFGCTGYEEGQQEVVLAPPTAGDFVPALQDSLLEVLPVPALELIPFDEESDWTYVQAPIDFRSDEISLQTYVHTIDTGGPDFATPAGGGDPIQVRRWMQITAVPRLVIFESNDADAVRVECSPEAALAEYVPETPGECSYTFRNSSSIAEGNAFEVALSVEWDVTFIRNDGPPGTFELNGPTVNVEDVRVAEVKAVNIY